MAKIVAPKAGHPLVGTWRDAAGDIGSSVQFTVHADGAIFEVTGLDTRDEKYSRYRTCAGMVACSVSTA